MFYDLTTVGVEATAELAGDVRRHGTFKDGGIARQFAHRVWEGNTTEATTLKPVVEEVLSRTMLDNRIKHAQSNVALFNAPNETAETRIMINSKFSCTVCHER